MWSPAQVHEHAVDPDADTAGGRHPVLHRSQIVLVQRLCLDIPAGSQGDLRLESATLVDRIVQLTEGIGQLMPCLLYTSPSPRD